MGFQIGDPSAEITENMTAKPQPVNMKIEAMCTRLSMTSCQRRIRWRHHIVRKLIKEASTSHVPEQKLKKYFISSSRQTQCHPQKVQNWREAILLQVKEAISRSSSVQIPCILLAYFCQSCELLFINLPAIRVLVWLFTRCCCHMVDVYILSDVWYWLFTAFCMELKIYRFLFPCECDLIIRSF